MPDYYTKQGEQVFIKKIKVRNQNIKKTKRKKSKY